MTKHEAMKALGVSISTLKRYAKNGMIGTSKYSVPGKIGMVNYWDDDVMALLGRKIHKGHEIVGYIRINGVFNDDKAKLNEQRNTMRLFTNKRGIALDKVYEDIGASTDYSASNRPGLHALFTRIMEGHIDAIVIDSKDRLSRLGYELIETLFSYYGTEIIIMNPAMTDEYYQQEQSDDIAKLLDQAKIDRLGS